MSVRVIRVVTRGWPCPPGVNHRCGPKCGPHQAGLKCRRTRLHRVPSPGINRHRLTKLKRYRGGPRLRINRLCLAKLRPQKRFSGGPRPRFLRIRKISFLPRRGGRDTWRTRPSRHCPRRRVLVARSTLFLASSPSSSGQDSSVQLTRTLEREREHPTSLSSPSSSTPSHKYFHLVPQPPTDGIPALVLACPSVTRSLTLP